MIVFLAFVLNCWILIPAAKWGNLGIYKHGLMSNSVLLANGTTYPLTALLTPETTLNETAYAEYGPLYLGPQMLWGIFFDYASYTSAWVWMGLFGYKSISATIKKLRARSQSSKSINHQYDDQLNILQRSYKEVPLWWYIALFLCSFLSIMVPVAAGKLYIPWWTYFIAIATGAAIVTVSKALYDRRRNADNMNSLWDGYMQCLISNWYVFLVQNFPILTNNVSKPIGTFNELIYGVMVNAVSGHKSPVGATVYSSIAGDAWYRAQYMLQDQKIGHYMHIPPRATFFSQVFGCTIGIPVNYGVVRWVLNTKFDYLTGAETGT